METITGFYLLDFLLQRDLRMLQVAARHLVLPALTLGIGLSGFIARLTRVAVMEEMQQSYIRTARSKGLSEWVVFIRHALRNAWLPIVTVLGLQFGNLLGGAAITETVFSWPGLGKLLVDSIYVRDYPQVQASILLLASTYVLTTLAVDVLYVVIDPRIRQ
jgi:peptide/nickel transport system permease protein